MASIVTAIFSGFLKVWARIFEIPRRSIYPSKPYAVYYTICKDV
jgi:hypothetical protein